MNQPEWTWSHGTRKQTLSAEEHMKWNHSRRRQQLRTSKSVLRIEDQRLIDRLDQHRIGLTSQEAVRTAYRYCAHVRAVALQQANEVARNRVCKPSKVARVKLDCNAHRSGALACRRDDRLWRIGTSRAEWSRTRQSSCRTLRADRSSCLLFQKPTVRVRTARSREMLTLRPQVAQHGAAGAHNILRIDNSELATERGFQLTIGCAESGISSSTFSSESGRVRYLYRRFLYSASSSAFGRRPAAGGRNLSCPTSSRELHCTVEQQIRDFFKDALGGQVGDGVACKQRLRVASRRNNAPR